MSDYYSNRIREELEGKNKATHQYVRRMSRLLGEYIDQFTTVPDHRTTKEILSRVPKCCMPGWKPKKDEPTRTS